MVTIRADRVKPKCKTGKPCGDICIPQKAKCRQEESPTTKPAQQSSVLPWAIAAVAAAGAIGVPVATYAAVRSRYRAGFKESARMAQQMADSIEPDPVKERQHSIIFGVGGLSYGGEDNPTISGKAISDSIRIGLSKDKGKDFKVVPVSNIKSNTGKLEAPKNPIDAAVDALRVNYQNIVVNNRNQSAVELASQVLAYSRKYPDKQLVMMGHSMGGMIVREAQEILREANPDLAPRLKSAAIGSVYGGLTEPFGNAIDVAGSDDPLTATFPTRNPKIFKLNSPKPKTDPLRGHYLSDYLKNPQVSKFLSDFIYQGVKLPEPATNQPNQGKQKSPKQPKQKNKQKPKTDSLRTYRDKPNCNQGKPCGTICIPKNATCRIGESKPPTSIQNQNLLPTTIASGAALLGVSTAGYLATRLAYRSGIPKSAQMAIELSKKVDVPDIGDDKQHVTFTVGGFYGQYGDAAARKGEDYFEHKMKTEVLDDTHFVTKHRNLEFNLPEDDLLPTLNWDNPIDLPTKIDAGMRVVTEHYKKTLEPVFKHGRNPEAVKLAAEVHAFKQKYPNKEINLCGHSAGGMITHETAEILHQMGIKAKVVNLGTGWYGFTEKVGESHTIVDKQDMYLKTMAIPRDPITVGDGRKPPSFEAHTLKHYMRSNAVKSQLKSLLNTAKKDSIYDKDQKEWNKQRELSATKESLENNWKRDSDISILSNPLYQRLIRQLKIILDRVYTDGIDHFIKVNVDKSNTITGLFRDGTKILDFTIKGNDITYKLATEKSKQDSVYYESLGLELALRSDANSKTKDKCVKGISCGAACVAANKSCRLKANAIASFGELAQLRTTAAQVGGGTAPPAASRDTYEINPDTNQPYTIRELKKKASEKGVYRYSEMTSDQLKEALQATDTDPDQRERLGRTLTRERSITGRAQRAGLIGKTKPEKQFVQWIKEWNKISKFADYVGKVPLGWGLTATAAILAGTSIRAYEQAKDHYRQGLNDSARAAEARAVGMDTDRVSKENIAFVVGGFSGLGHSSQKMRELLEEDQQLSDKNHYVQFDPKETNIPPYEGSKRNPDGSYSLGYLGYVATRGVGQFCKDLTRQRNDDAVELAAQIYAHAVRRNTTNYEMAHKDKSINIVAHSVGGEVVNQAMDILSRMKAVGGKGSPAGKDILERVNIVNLSAPDTGFAENLPGNYRNITSGQDPFSWMPKRREKWVSTVKGNEPEDYIRDPEVREQIRQGFGYYDISAKQRERKEKTRSRKKKESSTAKPKPKLREKPSTVEQKSDAYWEAFNAVRLDAIRKKAKCKTGKPCGDICIPKKAICHEKVGKAALTVGAIGLSGLAVAAGAVGLASQSQPKQQSKINIQPPAVDKQARKERSEQMRQQSEETGQQVKEELEKKRQQFEDERKERRERENAEWERKNAENRAQREKEEKENWDKIQAKRRQVIVEHKVALDENFDDWVDRAASTTLDVSHEEFDRLIKKGDRFLSSPGFKAISGGGYTEFLLLNNHIDKSTPKEAYQAWKEEMGLTKEQLREKVVARYAPDTDLETEYADIDLGEGTDEEKAFSKQLAETRHQNKVNAYKRVADKMAEDVAIVNRNNRQSDFEIASRMAQSAKELIDGMNKVLRDIENWDIGKDFDRIFNQFKDRFKSGFGKTLQSRSTKTFAGNDWWDALEVKKNSSEMEVKQAFKKKARQYHPDINKAPDAEERMKEIVNAYELWQHHNKK